MAIKDIIRMGHPTLGQAARAISAAELNSPWLRELIGDMTDTLDASGGIGLAAPQIDVGVRLAMIRIKGGATRYGKLPPTPLTVFINPRLRVLDETPQGFWEGCLSVPELRGYVERPSGVGVEYLTPDGEERRGEYQGFMATVMQHEFDHLDGILFPQRMKDLSLLMFESEYCQFHAEA